ncbi:MAG: peptidoglycan/LPS O-acetylase OafA/YrhL [Myxococcota bacterium]
MNEQLFALASGSAMGIYYYVFIAALCLLAIWPLSRLPDRWLDAFVILVVLISFGTRLSPPNTNMFWAMRDPTNYFFAYFVVGWWIGARRPGIGEWARRHRGALWAVCVLLLVGYALVDHEQLGVKIWGLPRFIYALTIGAMVSLYWLKVRDGHEASRWVVYLSRATYPIFLYHLIFIRLLQRSTGKALHFDPPILTSILLVGVGIGASLLLCASVNRLSPRLARNVFGMG